MVKKIKNTCRGHTLLVILMEKNIGKILQKRIAKTNRKEPKVEKVIK